MQFKLSTTFLLASLIAMAFALWSQNSRHHSAVRNLKRNAQFKTAVDANTNLLRHHLDLSEPEFDSYVRTKLITILINLWQRENEYNVAKDVFSNYNASADSLAWELLNAYEIRSHSELMLYAMEKTRYNPNYIDPAPDYVNNPVHRTFPMDIDFHSTSLRFPEISDPKSAEYNGFKRFVERVLVSNPHTNP